MIDFQLSVGPRALCWFSVLGLIACDGSGSNAAEDGGATFEGAGGGSASGGVSQGGDGAAGSGGDSAESGVGATGGGGGSGGDATGSGGRENVPEPSLVTSAKGDYWQEGSVAEGSLGVVTLAIDSAAHIGTWYGFGGAFNERGWAALLELSEADRQTVMRLLFDDFDGLGLDWARIPIGPNDYSIDRYSLSDSPGHFDISRDEEYLIPFVQAAQAIKGDIQFWASPWTPPPWAKVDDGLTENDGHDKGLFDVAHYEDFANYIVAWVDAYEQRGIPIEHVQPTSEPGFAQSYPSCAFGPTFDTSSVESRYTQEPVSLGPFVVDYLKPALDATPYGTKIWFGALTNYTTFNAYWSSLTDLSAISGVSLHAATQSGIAEVKAQGLLVMQTQHPAGNYPFLSTKATSREDADRDNFLAERAPNNHAYGEESWDHIKSWIDDGANIYSTWNMVLDNLGFNLDVVRPWPQNALITVDTEAKSYEITPYYYVLRHLSRYVDVGATVLFVSGDVLAFQNPDGSFVVVVFNRETDAVTHTLDLDGTLLEFSVPARGWVTVNWEG